LRGLSSAVYGQALGTCINLGGPERAEYGASG